MPAPNIHVVTEVGTLEDAFEHLARLQKVLKYLLDGNLDFENIRVGGITVENIDVTGLLTAIRAEIDTLISHVTIVHSLAAEKGYIAELTVDQLETSDKVIKFLNGDTSDVNYIRIYDQYVQWITATTDGLEYEQAKDRFGNPLFWKDGTKSVVTTEETTYPVYIYVYDELVKMEFSFQPDESGTMTPMLILGAGSGTGDNAKGFIYKDVDGLLLRYINTNGQKVELRLGEDGLILTPYELKGLNLYSNGFSANYGGQTMTYRWTKDSEGRIIKLTNVETGDEIPINWNDSPI